MKQQKKEIVSYVRNYVEDYEIRLQLALKRMDRMRCPLSMADSYLYDEIVETITDWCCDNDIEEDPIEWDELIDGMDGLIWEE